VAVIVTVVDVATGRAVTGKLAALCPAGTRVDAGTVAVPGLLLESWMTRPPAGAGALRVTCPVDAAPRPRIVGGDRVTADGTGGTTMSWAVRVVPAPTAVIVRLTGFGTGPVWTRKLFVVAPTGTVTEAGTTATSAGAELERVTTTPPFGAGPLSLTCPVEV
jgi:hypothetical protein